MVIDLSAATGKGTRTDVGADALDQMKRTQMAEEKKKTPKQKCEESGGYWDAKTNSCLIVPPQEKKEEVVEVKAEPKNKDQVLRNEQGNISGVTIGGKTYLGLNAKDVEGITAAEQAKTKGGQATQAFEQRATAAEQALQAQQMAEQQQQAISNLGLNPSQIAAIQSGLVEAPIDFGQAFTAGGARILPSAITGAGTGLAAGLIGGATTGAIAGTALTPGLGTAIGAGVGLLAGLVSGVLSNIKSQQKGEISASQDVLSSAKTNMRKLSSMASKDPANAALYVDAYNMQLSQVYQAQAQIKLETSGNLNKFMEDGTDILSDFELFLQPNGQADIYRRQLEMALTTGVAPALTVDDFAE
jgi:hypothetical protein